MSKFFIIQEILEEKFNDVHQDATQENDITNNPDAYPKIIQQFNTVSDELLQHIQLLKEEFVVDNNIVFYATHSNYLIDKSNLNRSFKVKKADNIETKLEKISKTQTSYSEINFEIFNIPTNNYHNELYGFIEENNKAKLNNLKKDTKQNRIESSSKRKLN